MIESASWGRACSLPELADDTPVCVRTDNSQQSIALPSAHVSLSIIFVSMYLVHVTC